MERGIRRAFTSFQLMTIQEENHHSFLILEQDPMLNEEDGGEMVELHDSGPEADLTGATILLYSPPLDPHLHKMTDLANRMFCIYSEQARGRTKAKARMSGAQKTLEA